MIPKVEKRMEIRLEATIPTTETPMATAMPGRAMDRFCLLYTSYPAYTPKVAEDVTFITSQELEDRYPGFTPKQREDAICKECGTVFLMQIGGKLKGGKPHDGRAPDYDDWKLNEMCIRDRLSPWQRAVTKPTSCQSAPGW